MNIVTILIDSLNRHHLPMYADTPVSTPHMQSFAERAWQFDNHFVGSLPCMPARRELMTGRKEFMWRPWGPIEPFDARLPELLAAAGYTTGIVTDHYHYWEEPGNGYIQSFHSTEMIRGHEIDNWKPAVPEDAPVPEWVQRIEHWRPGQGRRYFGNVQDFATEEDFFPAKVARGASAWLEAHGTRDPFYLQVEMFDVHEPFHVPEPYASMYSGHKLGDNPAATNWPPYQSRERQAEFMHDSTAETLEHVRSQYFGKITMVDRWLGHVFATLDRLGLWEETAVIITTDHGHDLGERGTFGKSYPHYDTHANIPLWVWHPDFPGHGRHIDALTSTVDVFGTILELAGAKPPTTTHSRSLIGLLSGTPPAIRNGVVYGTFGQGVCVTDGEWTLFKSPAPEHASDLYLYSSSIYRPLGGRQFAAPVASGCFIPGVDLPQWKIPATVQPHTFENFLFHRRDDPEQERNLWDSHPDERTRMLELLGGLLAAEGVPAEQWNRLGLTAVGVSPT
jgi:arylsulfatase A-like enzyme